MAGRMGAAAAQFGHARRVFAVLAAVFAVWTVGFDAAIADVVRTLGRLHLSLLYLR
jgi:hypothetical protein